jgi:hypothetical protein
MPIITVGPYYEPMVIMLTVNTVGSSYEPAVMTCVTP